MVKLYTADHCKYSKMAKEWLERNGIGFEERNTSENSEFLEDLVDMGRCGVPVLLHDTKEIVGFVEEEYEEELL